MLWGTPTRPLSLAISGYLLSYWHKRQKGYNRRLSSPSSSCSGPLGSFSTTAGRSLHHRAALFSAFTTWGSPEQPGPSGILAYWRCPWLFRRRLHSPGHQSLAGSSGLLHCLLCGRTAVHGCAGSLGIHHRHHFPLQVLGKIEAPTPSPTLFSPTHHVRRSPQNL